MRRYFPAYVACLAIAALSASAPTARAFDLSSTYIVSADSGVPGVPRVPEGVAYDPVGHAFFATAFVGGRVSRVDARTGAETTFYQGDPALAFSGIKVADQARVAWFCASNLEHAAGYVYAVRIRGAQPGKLLRRFELPPPFICNDLDLDSAGDVYVTNSAGPQIMVVPSAALWQSWVLPEVFASSEWLVPDPDAAPVGGQNGIAVTPDDRYLIVSRGAPNRLLRVSLDDPDNVQPLEFTGDAFGVHPDSAGDPSAFIIPDGLTFVGDTLYAIYLGGIQQLTFDPGSGYLSAHVVTTTEVPFGLTTSANAEGALYAVESDIQALMTGEAFTGDHAIWRIDEALFSRD